MGPTALLARYIGRQFLLNFLGLFLAIMAIVWVFEFVEQLRRVSTRPEAGIGVALELSLLKLPITMEHLVHFTVLFGAMFTFWRLTRSQELVIARASGVSAWQFLFPVVAAAVLIGAVKVAMVNPVSAVLVAQFEALEDRYIHGRSDLLAVSRSGLWLREKDEGGFWVIHAQRTAPDEILLENALFLRFDPQDRYTGRIDAETARLDGGAWHLERAWLADGDRAPEFRDRHSLPSRLTAEAIQDGFAPPEALSFWDLPEFIANLEATGFSAVQHRLYYNAQLAQPLLLAAMVLFAAAFSLSHSRRGGTLAMILAGVLTGFVLFVAADVIFALGLNGELPIYLAAWSPAAISLLVGTATLLHLEDG